MMSIADEQAELARDRFVYLEKMKRMKEEYGQMQTALF
jgi:hypothetical protein